MNATAPDCRSSRRSFLRFSFISAALLASVLSALLSLTLFSPEMGGISASAQQPPGVGVNDEDAAGDTVVSAVAVRQAIQRGVTWLKSQQRDDGTWGDYNIYRGGLTSLAMHALLTCGEPINDPAIERGLHVVRLIPLDMTYVVSLKAMVLSRAGEPTDQMRITECVRWLEQAQCDDGGWSYTSAGGGYDLSNTQFAVLGLYEAERYGVTVSPQTWQRLLKLLQTVQNNDGSWGYSGGGGTGSMTCAGIGSMMMALDAANSTDARVRGDRIECCLDAPPGDDTVAKGMRWLGRNFTTSQNPGSGSGTRLYYLYGIERIGRLTGNRFFVGEAIAGGGARGGGEAKKHDWYREGCHSLLTWKGSIADHWSNMGGMGEDHPLVATSLSLLFLAKGRIPILFSVLDATPSPVAAAPAGRGAAAAKGAPAAGGGAAGGFAGTGNWNPHRAAFRNLTDYVGLKWKMELAYQTIPLDRATTDDLAASPVLYLGGRQPLYAGNAATRQRVAQMIRDYIQRGGFLFVAADDPAFDRDFREWITLAFPEPEYAMKLIPASHPIWRNEEILGADQARPVYGIEFGCRTSVVYVPCGAPEAITEKPLSCLWELSPSRRNRLAQQPRYAKVVESQIQGGLTLGINILAYATNRRLEGKEEIFDRENAEHSRDSVARGKLAIASILHAGGCNAAPRALSNLLEEASAKLRYRIDTESVELTATDPKIFRYPILFIHGRDRFQFTDPERAALRLYLERGGTILADAVCGNEEFTASFRGEMAHILPHTPMEPIPPDAPVWTAALGGFDLARTTRREVIGTRPDGALDIRETVGPPLIEAVSIEGKYRVFFSSYDLSCALEKADSIGCRGYQRNDAARIALNIVLYGSQW